MSNQTNIEKKSSNHALGLPKSGDNKLIKNDDTDDTDDEGIKLLKHSLTLLQDSEKKGIDTLNQLDKQIMKIKNTKNNIKDINKDLGKSNSILSKMGKWWR
jgi:hypothetical protein